jgi:YgiT-type zinc finger domain-containing protein
MKEQQNTKLMVCDICGVKAARTVKRPQVLGRGVQMILVDNVPVIDCRNCGESYMTSETMHRLDGIRSKQKAKPTARKIAVAEFIHN